MKTPISQLSPHLGSVRPFEDRIVSLDEASEITGLSKDTIRRCHEREELEIIRLSPRRVGIRLSKLWAFIDGRAA
jgi:predicted DNA-binding transcriptional regulator AlpA